MPTTVTSRTYGPWQLYKTVNGKSELQGNFPTIEACEAEMIARGITFTYVCRQAVDVRVVNAPVPTSPTGPSGTNYPIIFNATTAARAGDVISLQGENLANAKVSLSNGTALEIVNRLPNWLGVQIPTTASGPIIVRVTNDTGTSALIKLNASLPVHLDAMRIVTGGLCRIFGKNLMLPGATPKVMIGGQPATIDTTRSDENMLVVTVPSVAPTAQIVITTDNGNGTGPTTLDRKISIVEGSGDPFGLGVGWAAGFTPIATKIYSVTAVGDEVSDATAAIQGTINQAGDAGGGVVRLPAGKFKVSRFDLRWNVVLEGAGKAQTEIIYSGNYAFYAQGMDLVGVRNLTMTNNGAQEGPLMKQGTRCFLQNVRFKLGTSRQMYLDGNTHFVVQGCNFELTENMNYQGPYTISNTTGLVFQGNTTQWSDGAPAFGRCHDSFIQGNRFIRDIKTQDGSRGTFHAMTLDFTHHIAVVGNSFEVLNGPVTNKTRNDGETILTEGGGKERTENIGTVVTATATTFSDPGNTFNFDPFQDGQAANFGVAIVAGKGAGQTRSIVSYNGAVITVDRPWDSVPDNTSKYATFVWGIEKGLIKGNLLTQNPRGIWIYHSGVRDLDIIGNTISEGGGIYLRSYQNLSTKSFMPIYNVLISKNKVSNSTGNWMSYINSVFVNADAKVFGVATIGIEMRSNEITANRPNVGSQYEEYASGEGFVNMMRIENYNGVETSPFPRLVGTIIANDTASNCDHTVSVGTGSGGATIINMKAINSGGLDDWATTGSGEKSVGTIMR